MMYNEHKMMGVNTHRFVFIAHPGDDTKCRTKSSQMGKKIYKLVKEK